jgi:uncharacterized protein
MKRCSSATMSLAPLVRSVDTATAARVYNVLVSEGRRLAAALIAV